MKKFKSVISVILAFVMLLGCTSVFASAAHPDKIETVWGYEYFYAGEVALGDSYVKSEEADKYYYYVFNAENDGYYSFDYDSSGNICWLYFFEESYSGYYNEVFDSIYGSGKQLIYLESGDNYIGFSLYEPSDEAEKLSIEYMGSEITDISFDAGTEYPLIMDYDIYSGSNKISLEDFCLMFDIGKKAEFREAGEYFYCYCEEDVVIGENNFEIEVDGKLFKKTLTVAHITDYIEKVELVSGTIDEKIYYNGSIEGTDTVTLKITYTDGTSVVVNSGDEISLKNGNPYTYNVYVWSYGDTAEVVIAGYEFLEITCNSTEASFTENLGLFFSDIAYEFNYIKRIPERAEELLEQESAADTLREFGEFVSFVNNNFFYAIGDVFELLVMLFGTIS